MATRPTAYAAWAALAAATSVASYFVDPYVFAFTTLALAALTGIVALIGIAVCAGSRAIDPASRWGILLSLAAAIGAVATALAVLRGIRWA